MNDHLLRFNHDALFVCADFEGECLNLVTSKPWQFAAVVFKLKKFSKPGESRIDIVETHDIYIGWENLNVSEDAARITRFDKNKWERLAKDPKEVFEKIQDIYNKALFIVGHNFLGYDNHIDRNSRISLGLPVLPIHRKILDTFPLGKGLEDKLNIPYTPDKDLFQYQMKLYHYLPPQARKRGFSTLGALCKLFNVEYDTQKAHDALYDVTVNAEMFANMIHQIDI